MNAMYALVVIALILLLWATVYWYYVYWFKFVRSLHKLPHKWTIPLIGNAFQIVPLSELTQTMMGFRRLGKTFKFIVSYDITVGTADEKFVEYLSTSKDFLTKSMEYDFLKVWLNEGLLTSTGGKWHRRRKLLTPSFHFNVLEEFLSVFDRCGDVFVRKLSAITASDKATELDVYSYVTLYALDVIYETTMGVQINAQTSGENSDYVRAVKRVANLIMDKILVAWKRFRPLYSLSSDCRLEKRLVQVLHEATDRVIIARRDLIANEERSHPKRNCFLDILLRGTIDDRPLSNRDIREEVDTFLFEGHDTTSSAISFALYELSINPAVQARLRDELQAIRSGTEGRFRLADLNEMKYLEMVIKETIRKYPPVPVIGRTCEKDIDYDGMVIPKGTTLAILTYVLHREEETFPDPERFDPERFSPENRNKIGPYAYVPFSAGFRNCIGQKFAMLELKSILAKIVMHFELSPALNYEPKLLCELILRAQNGVRIKFRKLDDI